MEENKLSPVIPFNLIYDTDYGIIRYIRDTCKDAPNYNQGILNLHKIFLIQLLVNREVLNPVHLVMEDDEEFGEQADEIYNNIMKYNYQDVLVRSIPTAIHDYIAFLGETEGAVTPYILCNCDEEVFFIRKYFGPYKDGKCKIAIGKVDASKYDPLFTKSLKEMPDMYYNVGCNNIYLARYFFNIDTDDQDKEIPKMGDDVLLFMNNTCNIVNVYKDEYMNPEQYL